MENTILHVEFLQKFMINSREKLCFPFLTWNRGKMVTVTVAVWVNNDDDQDIFLIEFSLFSHRMEVFPDELIFLIFVLFLLHHLHHLLKIPLNGGNTISRSTKFHFNRLRGSNIASTCSIKMPEQKSENKKTKQNLLKLFSWWWVFFMGIIALSSKTTANRTKNDEKLFVHEYSTFE